jgi:hypothetical protein
LLAATEPQIVADIQTAGPGDWVAYPNEDHLSPQALQLIGQIRELDRKIAGLKSSRGMTDVHPAIQELLSERQSLAAAFEEQRVQDRRTTVPNSSLAAAGVGGSVTAAADPTRGERARLLVQIAAQKAKMKDVEISVETNELAMQQLQQAKRNIFQKQEEFAEIMGRVAQARQRHTQLQATLASIEPAIKAVKQDRLLQFSQGPPARGSHIPVSPRAITVVLLAVVAGVISGMLFVVLAEVFDHVYRSSGQVARGLGLPMLESIDEIVTTEDRRRLFLQKAVATPLVIICLVGLTGLTGSMAYLSIERPWTYEKMRKIPQAALRLFAGEPDGNVG